jgi:hypothetical protein
MEVLRFEQHRPNLGRIGDEEAVVPLSESRRRCNTGQRGLNSLQMLTAKLASQIQAKILFWNATHNYLQGVIEHL